MSRPYRPSNGTEGEIFVAAWCQHCARYGDDYEFGAPCPILTETYALDADSADYPKEWIESDDPRSGGTQIYAGGSYAKCTAFEQDGADPAPPRCEFTLEMFPDFHS